MGKGLGKVQTQFREELGQGIGRVQGLGKVLGKGLRWVRARVWVGVRGGPIILLHWSAKCFTVAVHENFSYIAQ